MQKNEFEALRQNKEAFPVTYELNGDEITPINVFYNLEGKNKIIMESVEFDKKKGRYSFIASNPYIKMKSFKDEICIEKKEETQKVKGKIIELVKKFMDINYNNNILDIPFTGGAIGYAGYDVIKQYENISDNNIDDLKIPEAYFMFYKSFICYDHLKHRIILVYNVFPEDDIEYSQINDHFKRLYEQIINTTCIHNIQNIVKKAEIHSNYTKDEFCKNVEKAKEYIKKGDIFQVVISQRLKCKTDLKAFDIYRKLRYENPSPYLFYMDFEDFQIVGSSPERLVAVHDGIVSTNPIAGTRRRGTNKEEDEKLKAELTNDEKEKAEHVMLVDLGRNDIGKVSEFGTVQVTKFMEVEEYSHVMHIVSEVEGKLKKNISSFDAFTSCIPAGTVSGAPKIRAMEIIDEIENRKRLLYAGAVGYFSFDKNMDTCIAIRTLVLKDKYAYIQAGAGIVYDSNPEEEYHESLNKAKALTEVI
ncbi:anthranilate synthase component I [Clostridium tyrobutyricum]|jgi:anthranilate synthase component 1|nr:anthranilate synthase component I [Clostridium tyrobutyricum]MBR9647709.1 anthranilate synthase component I [Clostridium tyrobutyricum]MBV4428095.1 anthranilate synthase component I [Clostridium tyrobutyricum]MBV4430549.1 anthranilate synthase component I [Clostridium tyrobutyricum]MBV4434220.1 anthranilate synthase component I [Clostridium tyrobutyricum]MBV4437778.1 anthranilate synthase component I [Clostridium tyrobutyricum]